MILVIDWERNWRSNGIVAAVLFIIAFALYGMQPKVGATAVKLVSNYDGDSTRILIATVIFGFGTLTLMWSPRRSQACCGMRARAAASLSLLRNSELDLRPRRSS